MSHPPSSVSSNILEDDPAQELVQLIQNLCQYPEREAVASELEVLQSIYGEDAVKMWHPPAGTKEPKKVQISNAIRFEVILNLPSPHEDVSLRVLVSLPPTYPISSPPQLQLLSRYIGAFGADSTLFGSIIRTYISVNGVEWTPDTVCVFDGLQNVLEKCAAWYEARLTAEKVGDLIREDVKEPIEQLQQDTPDEPTPENSRPVIDIPLHSMPSDIQIHESEPITDRKSVFIGRACKIHHPSEVPLVLNGLMSDRKIARAAHPIINAWRCQVGNVLHQDNDDDGETAAGSRLAHLLQILEVNDVLVVVTRYFGGTHLGPDRFKHINQAARDALEVGGFLESRDTKKPLNTGRGKRP